MFTWLYNLRNRGLATRVIVLGVVVLVAFAVTVPIAIRLGGFDGLAAAGVASVLCYVGAAAALVIGDRLRGPVFALAALWLGMACRLGVPLAAGLTIHLHGGQLAKANLLCYLLVFYPITLAFGTVLSLPPTSWQPTPSLEPSSKVAS